VSAAVPIDGPAAGAGRGVNVPIEGPQAVIFDNDGLLLDTEDTWTRAEEALFARRGRVFTIEHKRSLLGSAGADAARKLEAMLEKPGEGGRLMDELQGLVMEEALGGVTPRPGALELVERLREAGVPIAVASNSRREFVERVLGSAGLLDGRFQAVVSAEEVAHPKPAPDVYLEAARRLGADPTSCTALEDSPTGVAAAITAGMKVIGVPYFPDAELPGCDLQAKSLADPEVSKALGLE
jgi:HAD superfamily hydrolase (TIGR01509 family)